MKTAAKFMIKIKKGRRLQVKFKKLLSVGAHRKGKEYIQTLLHQRGYT